MERQHFLGRRNLNPRTVNVELDGLLPSLLASVFSNMEGLREIFPIYIQSQH